MKKLISLSFAFILMAAGCMQLPLHNQEVDAAKPVHFQGKIFVAADTPPTEPPAVGIKLQGFIFKYNTYATLLLFKAEGTPEVEEATTENGLDKDRYWYTWKGDWQIPWQYWTQVTDKRKL